MLAGGTFVMFMFGGFHVTAIGVLASPQTVAPAAARVADRAVLNKYCVGCHNQRLKTAGLMLDNADLDQVAQNAALWEPVIARLRTRTMPPPASPRPDDAVYDRLVHRLEAELDKAAATLPNPGRLPIHRLNRAEYGSAVRDV